MNQKFWKGKLNQNSGSLTCSCISQSLSNTMRVQTNYMNYFWTNGGNKNQTKNYVHHGYVIRNNLRNFWSIRSTWDKHVADKTYLLNHCWLRSHLIYGIKPMCLFLFFTQSSLWSCSVHEALINWVYHVGYKTSKLLQNNTRTFCKMDDTSFTKSKYHNFCIHYRTQTKFGAR